MKQNINIAVLLKDCIKGRKLYSPICGECKLEYVEKQPDCNQYWIYIMAQSGVEYRFNQDGSADLFGECLLFPTKDIREWGLFNAFFVRTHSCMSLKDKSDLRELLIEKGGAVNTINNNLIIDDDIIWYIDSVTKKIKELNIHNMPYGAYVLQTGTELKPRKGNKFQVGDVVSYTDGKKDILTHYIKVVVETEDTDQYTTSLTDANNPEYGAKRLATKEEIAEWNHMVLEPNDLHFDSTKRKIVHYFWPFAQVIVRNSDIGIWIPRLFSIYRKSVNHYGTQDSLWYAQCLPYNEETAKLIGTSDKYEEK